MRHDEAFEKDRIITGRTFDDPLPGCRGRLCRTPGFSHWWTCRACGTNFQFSVFERKEPPARVYLLRRVARPRTDGREPGIN